MRNCRGRVDYHRNKQEALWNEDPVLWIYFWYRPVRRVGVTERKLDQGDVVATNQQTWKMMASKPIWPRHSLYQKALAEDGTGAIAMEPFTPQAEL